MKVLVTGGAGSVGSHLVDNLFLTTTVVVLTIYLMGISEIWKMLNHQKNSNFKRLHMTRPN